MVEKVKENRVLNIYKHFRRIFYYRFRQKYIQESISKRKGNCKQCGCCGTNVVVCKHYDSSTKKCKIVSDGGDFPTLCKVYPFDEFDKTAYSKVNCGFYWGKEK